jgi:hypothetical protein
MLNKIPVKLEILASKVVHSADKIDLRFLLKAHARKSEATRGFIFWRFLSWGIDYQTNNPKT